MLFRSGAAPLYRWLTSRRRNGGAVTWNGFLAPKGTPEAIVAQLQREVAKAVAHPDTQKRMTDVGAEPSGSTQEEMRTMQRDQVAKVRPVVEELKLVVE